MATRRDRLVAILSEGLGGPSGAILRGFLGYIRPALPWRLVTRHPRIDGTMELLERLQPDALLTMASIRQTRRFFYLGLPMFVCQGPLPESEQYDRRLVACCEYDDQAIGRMAAEHFVDMDLPYLACFGQSWSGTYVRRSEAFENEAVRHGRQVLHFYTDRERPTQKESPRIEEQADAVMRQWFLELPKPVGVLFSSSGYADHCSDLCRLAGIAIPEEICVLAAVEDRNITELAYPPVSAVNLPYEQVGLQAARQLERMLEGKPPLNLPMIQPQGVTVRASTSFVRFDNSRVGRAVAYIREHAIRPCSVEDVLRHTKCSRTYLDRIFRQDVGHSVFQEIRRRQIEAARSMLAHESLSMAEVAERCGFGSAVRFSTVFKQETGKTPRQYRKESLGGGEHR